MPFTSGSSGPTTINSIFSLLTSSSNAEKLFTFMLLLKHFASLAVPPFPGATKILLTCLDLDNFHANACSLPP